MNLAIIALALAGLALLIVLALIVLHARTRAPHPLQDPVVLADDPEWMSPDARLLPSLHDRGPTDQIIAARAARTHNVADDNLNLDHDWRYYLQEPERPGEADLTYDWANPPARPRISNGPTFRPTRTPRMNAAG